MPGLVLAACAAPSGPTGPDGAAGGEGAAGASRRAQPVRAPGTASTGTADRARSSSVPTRISVPAIELAEDLIGLGLSADNALEVPDDAHQLGWFSGGPRPGEPGPTVIAGHVDSDEGPAVFWRLTELVPGDRIEVRSADGVSHDYVVDGASDHPKEEFPTARVFGAAAGDELRLVTCTGPWMDSEASYRDNRVVYASAVEE